MTRKFLTGTDQTQPSGQDPSTPKLSPNTINLLEYSALVQRRSRVAKPAPAEIQAFEKAYLRDCFNAILALEQAISQQAGPIRLAGLLAQAQHRLQPPVQDLAAKPKLLAAYRSLLSQLEVAQAKALQLYPAELHEAQANQLGAQRFFSLTPKHTPERVQEKGQRGERSACVLPWDRQKPKP